MTFNYMVCLGKRDADLLEWLTNRLDIKRHLPQGKPADNLSLTRCVRYRLKTGLKVQINQVHGMPGNFMSLKGSSVLKSDQLIALNNS